MGYDFLDFFLLGQIITDDGRGGWGNSRQNGKLCWKEPMKGDVGYGDVLTCSQSKLST